jgi:hypothetical protein
LTPALLTRFEYSEIDGIQPKGAVVAANSGNYRRIMPLGDINGDGFSDVGIVYAETVTRNTTWIELNVYAGSPSGLKFRRTVHIDARDVQPPLGRDLASGQLKPNVELEIRAAGDFDGDGFTDIVISVNGFTGGPDVNRLTYVEVLGGSASMDFSRSVVRLDGYDNARAAGDVDGDGFADLALFRLLNDRF